jgi:TolB-like protein
VRFGFADYVLDFARRELWRGGDPVALEPRVFDLLAHLIRNRDRVVSKDDLLPAVWGGRIVSESTLASRINAVRKAVGDSGDAQRLIRTVARSGFRFVGEIAEEDATCIDHGIVEQTRRGQRDPPRLSIVVLPFANMTGDPEQEYFADGITENLTTDLSRIPESSVIVRSTAFTYKGRSVDVRRIGRELEVRYALEGSVQRFGTALQVNAQMIDAETGAHFWADRFDGDLSNLPELLGAITTRVWRCLFLKLPVWESRRSQREKPDNPDTVDYVLRALAIWNSAPTAREYGQIRSLLEAATRIDPLHVNAQVWLARADIAEAAQFLSVDRARQLDRAEERINRILAVAADDYLVHRTKADLLHEKKRPIEAVHHYELALRLNPSDVGASVWLGALTLRSMHTAKRHRVFPTWACRRSTSRAPIAERADRPRRAQPSLTQIACCRTSPLRNGRPTRHLITWPTLLCASAATT